MTAEFEKTNRIKLPQSGVEIELVETTDKDPCAKCVCRYNKETCIRGEYLALTCLIQSKPSHWQTVEIPENHDSRH